MNRRGIIALMVGLVCAGSVASATSLNLVYQSVSPGGSIILNGSTMSNHAEDVLAGVINWKNTGVTPNVTQYTYCIDVHDFLFSSTFTTESLGNSNLNLNANANEIKAIQNLFYDHSAPVEPTGPGNIDTTGALNIGPNGNVLAAEFQVALWDVLYNWTGTGITHVNNLTFTPDSSDPNHVLNATEITQAQAWATAAYGGNINRGANENVQGLYDYNNQSQAAYLGVMTNTPPVPTPSAALGGIALLGVLGVVRHRRLRR